MPRVKKSLTPEQCAAADRARDKARAEFNALVDAKLKAPRGPAKAKQAGMTPAHCLERFKALAGPAFASKQADAAVLAADWQAERAASGAAAGLVLHSTSHTGAPSVPPLMVEGANAWGSHAIEIDREAARVTRLRKGAGMAAKWINLNAHQREHKVMVTLTYAGDNRDWSPKHISAYLTIVRNWYRRKTGQPLRYVWVAELQKRGVIHYHVVFWLRPGVWMRRSDKMGWWPHGMTNTIKAHHPVGYLMKYLSKVDQKNVGSFPHGCRLYGVGGLDKGGRDCKRWVLWPSYVRQNAAAGDPFKPTEGGGYCNAETGERLLSEWRPTGGGHRHFIRIRVTPRSMPDAGGPFSWIN